MISVDALTFKFYSEQSTGLSCERCTCVGTYNQNVHIYDALTLQYVLQLTGHVGIINSIIVSPSGRFMFSSSSDSTIMVSIASFHIESTLCNNLWLLGFCVYEQDNWKKNCGQISLEFSGWMGFGTRKTWLPFGSISTTGNSPDCVLGLVWSLSQSVGGLLCFLSSNLTDGFGGKEDTLQFWEQPWIWKTMDIKSRCQQILMKLAGPLWN